MKFADVTPNLVVVSVERSLAFYRDVLGFSLVTTVPEAAPSPLPGSSATASACSSTASTPSARITRNVGRGRSGTATLFIVVEADTSAAGVDRCSPRSRHCVRVIMALKDQFYGMREFAIEDPDGYVITFAQRVAG